MYGGGHQQCTEVGTNNVRRWAPTMYGGGHQQVSNQRVGKLNVLGIIITVAAL